jgi:glycosyltransferase involved in cell wall biosynthesis
LRGSASRTRLSGRGSALYGARELALPTPGASAAPEAPPGVCMLSTDADAPTGGIQRQSLRLLEELGRRGVPVSLCTRNYHRKPREESRTDVLIHRTPVPRRSWRVANSGLYLADGLAWLSRNRARFDVLHCQQMFGSAMLGLAAGRLLGKPVIVRVTLSGPEGEVRQIRRLPLTGIRLRQLRAVDRWVALTGEMRDEIVSLGVPAEKVVVIPNAAHVPQRNAQSPVDQACARLQLDLTAPRIAVYAGRLSAEKGLDVLLDAWRLVHAVDPDAHLVLLGGGSDYRNVEGALRQQAERLGIDDVVHFRGHVPNVDDYLVAANAFVLPSRAEGMSNALVEALAAGAAVVASDIPANRAVVAHGETALLVPVEDAGALARAVARVFTEPELAGELGGRARAYAERELSVPAMASRYVALYREVVRERGR